MNLKLYYFMTGYIALKRGQSNRALASFKEACRRPLTWDIDPLEDCLDNAYLELGRLDEAVAEYRRILELNPITRSRIITWRKFKSAEVNWNKREPNIKSS